MISAYEALNKSILDLFRARKAKNVVIRIITVPFFIFQTLSCLKNGGASLHRRNL